MVLAEPKHRKGSFGGFMDRILHPGTHEEKEHLAENAGEHEPQHEGEAKKEGEMDKVKDYIKKDEEMEAEGRTYGDLM
ncbi:hypothetical protein N7452_007701 [Penicillium brevicompactum]|uniref:Uncharacterized protein n=1 Tax=Penicillium brevicompactum TaxID=5074 RepID=A0A9W9QG18_PENBR|nr:hypothetical protein N7452_007701 [Penicillium brevicompactum]